jgi:hypothetical protein
MQESHMPVSLFSRDIVKCKKAANNITNYIKMCSERSIDIDIDILVSLVILKINAVIHAFRKSYHLKRAVNS